MQNFPKNERELVSRQTAIKARKTNKLNKIMLKISIALKQIGRIVETCQLAQISSISPIAPIAPTALIASESNNITLPNLKEVL